MQVHRRWIPFSFRVLGAKCSKFMEKRRINETRGEKKGEEVTGASKSMRPTLTNTTELECPKDTPTADLTLAHFCHFLFLLCESPLQRSPSVTGARKTVMLCVSALWEDTKVVLIFMFMPHGYSTEKICRKEDSESYT